ncbi:MAG: M14 family zinc carboxypeptidase [Bacillota bacterium]
MKQLQQKYQSLTVTSYGKSLASQKLYLLKLGSGSKKIAVVGGVHGREGITSLLILKLVEDYLNHQNKEIAGYNLATILNQVTFYFIPLANPDGVEIAVNGLANINLKNNEFYKKANRDSTDFRRWKANGRGVDLNKQFRADWHQLEAKSEPHYAHYKGPSPESEPESKALADLTRKEDFASVVAFHNSGQVIYWYYKQDPQAYQRDYKLAQKLSAATNYELVTPQASDKYAAGYKDWFIKKFNRPGFTIEIGPKKESSTQPLSTEKLPQYWQQTRFLLLTLATNLNNSDH